MSAQQPKKESGYQHCSQAAQHPNYHDREVRRGRRILRITFAAGLLLGGALTAWFILHPIQLPALFWDPKLPEGASTVKASLISWGVACLVVGLAIFFPLRSLRRQKKILF